MVHRERYAIFVTFVFILMVGIGLVCIRKPNASCDACRDWKMKCEYPGKSGIGAGSGVGVSSGVGMSSPMKGRPVIVVPSPKCKSLEVQHQEIMVREQANELTEACLDVDHNMVYTMCDLADAMDRTSVGGSAGSSTGGWMAGVSVGVGWSGGSDRGVSKGKGKERERSEVGGDAGGTTTLGDGEDWGDDGGDDWSGRGGSGCGSSGDDNDDAPLVEYMPKGKEKRTKIENRKITSG